jgi:hypothetical protein
MSNQKYIAKASEYLNKFCKVKPNRRTGSSGNRDATNYFANTVKQLGYAVDTESFDCLNYKKGEISLTLPEEMPELMATITQTEKDQPYIIDTAKLVEMAEALKEVITSLKI